jgi:hypothetical protein
MSLSTNPLPVQWTDIKDHTSRIVRGINNILQGKLNNTGSVTLTANSATTTLSDPRIGINSVITLQATTANAAGAMTNVYFGTPGDGTVTINHSNTATVDRTIKYAVIS